MSNDSPVSGWYVFAGVLLGIAGVLNVIWGIAAISNSKFFTENATYIISSIHTWGWVTLILGALPLLFVGYLVLVRPEYIGLLVTTPLGILLIVVGVVLLIIGAFWLRKVVKVEV